MIQCDFRFPVNNGDLEKGAHLEGQLWFGEVSCALLEGQSAFRSNAAPILCVALVMKSFQNTRFPQRLPRKVTTMSENARGATTRAQSRQAPALATQISRACAVEIHFEDFERRECAVHSSIATN